MTLRTIPTEMASPGSTTLSPAERLAAFFPVQEVPLHDRDCFDDKQIYQISDLLQRIERPWSKVPRTYIVLRTLGHLNILNDLIALGFTDDWFPVDIRSLPDIVSPSVRSQIVRAQRLILTQSMNLEKGENGTHCHFARGEPLPFLIEHKLGSGGFSQVNQVTSLLSYQKYALKRIRRRAIFGNRTVELIQRFTEEVQIVKKLKHHHIVAFVGSYTDSHYLGLLTSPVADCDLAAYLEKVSTTGLDRKLDLRTYFGCLAAALQYLHNQSIRHKDIKPQNILIERGNVLLTDFGLSLDFSQLDGSTTSGVTAKSPRYCAPEVADANSRNTSADIWSLGCVYLEMVAALKGKSPAFIKDFFQVHGTKELFYYCNIKAIDEFITLLETCESAVDNTPLAWVVKMLNVNRDDRPTAARLFNMITMPNHDEYVASTFCGICCLEDDYYASSASMEDAAELELLYRNQPGVMRTALNTMTDNNEGPDSLRQREVSSVSSHDSPAAPSLPMSAAKLVVDPTKSPPRLVTRDVSSVSSLDLSQGQPTISAPKRKPVPTELSLDEQGSETVKPPVETMQVTPKIKLEATTSSSEDSRSTDLSRMPDIPPSSLMGMPPLPKWKKGTSQGFSFRRLLKSRSKSATEVESQGHQKVFNVALEKSISYAHVAIAPIDVPFDDAAGKAYGYVPIVVAKCGVFLKVITTSSKHESRNLFETPGNPERVSQLKGIFDSPPRYGRGLLSWDGYTIYDCADTLKQYLTSLPQPIIGENAEKWRYSFLKATKTPDSDAAVQHSRQAEILRTLIAELPVLNRLLLLYVNDILCVVASKSEYNYMTPSKLAQIFRVPYFLNGEDPPSDLHSDIERDMIVFMIENQDETLWGLEDEHDTDMMVKKNT